MLNDVVHKISDGLMGFGNSNGTGVHIKIGASPVRSSEPIIITSSKKNICCNPATTIPFAVHWHTSMRLMTVCAGYTGSINRWTRVFTREIQKARNP